MNLRACFAVLVASFALSGCASPYEIFYQGTPSAASLGETTLPPTGEPKIGTVGDDPRRTVLSLYEQGYGLIGTASFVGEKVDDSDALRQAKKVGAALVLVSQKYRNTVSGFVPVTTPTTTTSYNTGGAYNGTMTTYSTQTEYIPYSVDKYDQGALFFAVLSRTGLGIHCGSATDEQKRAADTNQVVSIDAVRQESPAFTADILAGDLLLGIDGRPLHDCAAVTAAVTALNGKPAAYALWRNGKKISKTIHVPDSW